MFCRPRAGLASIYISVLIYYSGLIGLLFLVLGWLPDGGAVCGFVVVSSGICFVFAGVVPLARLSCLLDLGSTIRFVGVFGILALLVCHPW